jgi:hypothetical protein
MVSKGNHDQIESPHAARDATKPVEYYRAFIAAKEQAMQYNLGKGLPQLFGTVSRYCLQIASASYSAGESAEECGRWLAQSADYQRRFLAEGRQYKLGGIGDQDEHIERFFGAYLVGKAADLVEAFRRSTFQEFSLYEKALMHPLWELLKGEPVTEEPAESADLRKKLKSYVCLPRLFQAVSRKDSSTFASLLGEYLETCWAPAVEKYAKAAIKSKEPDYMGKWCFLSAGVCRMMGTIPELPKNTGQYIPLDLVAVPGKRKRADVT